MKHNLYLLSDLVSSNGIPDSIKKNTMNTGTLILFFCLCLTTSALIFFICLKIEKLIRKKINKKTSKKNK